MDANHHEQQRVWLEWIIIVLFFLFILLPEVNRQFTIISDITLNEKRTLAPAPVLNIREVAKFIREFSLFYNEHFGFRNRLVAANSRINLFLFRFSSVRTVIVGKMNWLFFTEAEPTHPNSLLGSQGYYPYTPGQLVAIKNNLESENIWFNQKNITFLIFPAPDKYSIYSEYLPWPFDSAIGPSRQTQVFDYIRLNSNVPLLDITQALLNGKKLVPLEVYFKSDTHWNSVGAFFAYEEIMKHLLVTYPQFVPYRLEDFVQDRTLKWQGDLTIMAQIDMLHVLEHQLIPKQNISFYQMEPKKDKLLIFCDSFGRYFLKDYFRRHFNDIKVVNGRRYATSKLEKDIILHYKPNVVIFESVERYWTSL